MQNSNHLANQISAGWKSVVDHYSPPLQTDAKFAKVEEDINLVEELPCKTCIFWKDSICRTTKKRCPYRLGLVSRVERKNACWHLHGIDGRKCHQHWKFVRKPQRDGTKIVHPQLSADLSAVQSHFESYISDISERVIILKREGGPSVDCMWSGGRSGPVKKWSPKRDMVEHLLEDGSELVLDYKTRFTDPGRSKADIKKFHGVWSEASKYYDGAVFLTLTSDPSSRESLWHVNRHFAPAWNSYLSLLSKRFRQSRRDELIDLELMSIKKTDPSRWQEIDNQRRQSRDRIAQAISTVSATPAFLAVSKQIQESLVVRYERRLNPYQGLSGEEIKSVKDKVAYRTDADGHVVRESYRPKYMSVYEYMSNGLLHAHITIFGTTWLDKISQIKTDWERLGQGSIVHAYAMLKNPSSNVWEWLGKPPLDTKNRQPVDYLIKYLIKGLYTKESHGMYWAMNKRFFTNSRSLHTGWINYKQIKSVWKLVASFHSSQIPLSIKKQQRGAPLLKAWYDFYGTLGGPPFTDEVW